MKERTLRGWIGGAFTAVTLGWLLLVLLTPVALAQDVGGRAVTLTAAGTYLLGGVVCHQRPDRSFHPGGVKMPVCARCAGLYLGAGLGVLAAAGFRVIENRGEGAVGGKRGQRPRPGLGAGIALGGDLRERLLNSIRSGEEGRLVGMLVVAERG